MRFLTIFSLLGVAQAITRGINIYGCETERSDFTCTWANPIEFYVDKVYELGFNSIRAPFSYQYVVNGDFTNMDRLFHSIEGKNMTVILDFHRINNRGQSPVPTDGITEEQFWDAWITIADRYKDREQLVGLDIFNEYQGSDTTYWNDFLKRTVLHLEDRFPERFQYIVGGTNWGGNLAGITLEDVPFHERVFYTGHKYIFSGNSNPADWDISLGSFPKKVIIGEWGFKVASQGEDQSGWARTFIDYLKKRDIRNTYFWTIANSGDTGGIFNDDCNTINWEKYNIIKTLWEDNPSTRYLRGFM